MPDLRQTRKDIKTSLAIMVAVDVIALAVFFSPLVGSTESRSQALNQLSSELQTKTRDVEPLKNLDKKVITANQQIVDFYKKRFPAQDSQIIDEFGKLAAANGVKIEQAKYPVKVKDEAVEQLYPVEMEATLAGSYVSLAKFISSIELGGEQQGPIKLQMKLVTYLKAGA
jgi:Tfp pilus assembly protein PilO